MDDVEGSLKYFERAREILLARMEEVSQGYAGTLLEMDRIDEARKVLDEGLGLAPQSVGLLEVLREMRLKEQVGSVSDDPATEAP